MGGNDFCNKGNREMALIIRSANVSRISQKSAFVFCGVNKARKSWVWARRVMAGQIQQLSRKYFPMSSARFWEGLFGIPVCVWSEGWARFQGPGGRGGTTSCVSGDRNHHTTLWSCRKNDWLHDVSKFILSGLRPAERDWICQWLLFTQWIECGPQDWKVSGLILLKAHA